MKPHLEKVRRRVALRKTLEALGRLETEIKEKQEMFEALEDLIKRQIVEDYHEEMPERPIPNKENLTFGDWQCLASPTRKCIYDLGSQYGEDECLYCGKPNERK